MLSFPRPFAKGPPPCLQNRLDGTERSSIDSRDVIFAAEAADAFGVLEESSNLLVDYMSNAADDPLLILDTDWKADVYILLLTQEMTSENIRDMEPGPLTRSVHPEMLLLADGIESYVYYYNVTFCHKSINLFKILLRCER